MYNGGTIDHLYSAMKMEARVLAEALTVIDTESFLWPPVSSLLNAALKLEQQTVSSWHGWRKEPVEAFLKSLPAHCTLLVGVWETESEARREQLAIGFVCEVSAGAVCSLRTFEALPDIPDVQALEPGVEDALSLMKAAQGQVAPVAWALFTDKATWDEWLFADDENGNIIEKGELLASFARQGRCVLMGSQTKHHHL